MIFIGMVCFNKFKFRNERGFRDNFSGAKVKNMTPVPGMFSNSRFVNVFFLNIFIVLFNSKFQTALDLFNTGKNTLVVVL